MTDRRSSSRPLGSNPGASSPSIQRSASSLGAAPSPRRPRSRQGFTLVELLCTIVVLLLVGALMVTGVQLATRIFSRSVSASEAQLLCSTLKTTVSDELRYAGTTTQTADGIAFFSQNYGESVRFTADEDGHVLLGGKKLLPARSYPYGIRAEVLLTGYDAQKRLFDVTVTVTSASGAELSAASFQVRQLNQPASGS